MCITGPQDLYPALNPCSHEIQYFAQLTRSSVGFIPHDFYASLVDQYTPVCRLGACRTRGIKELRFEPSAQAVNGTKGQAHYRNKWDRNPVKYLFEESHLFLGYARCRNMRKSAKGLY